MTKEDQSKSTELTPSALEEKECLLQMNKFLKELKIEWQWEKYENIRVVGQPSRLIFYTIVGITFPIIYAINQSIRLFPQQNVVVQILSVIVVLVLQQILPRHTYTIQLSAKDSVKIANEGEDKERFVIATKMHSFMKESERSLRLKKFEEINLKKKK